MKSTKQIFILSALAFSAAILLGCNSTGSYSQSVIEQYPLDNYSEVFETSRSVEEVFNDTRSFLLDEYSNSASSIAVQSQTNMIILPVETSFKWVSTAANADLRFTIVVEVKEGKVRLSTKDIKLVTYGYNSYTRQRIEYYMYNESGYNGSGYMTLRKNGSELYQEKTDVLSKKMASIAEGTLYSSDW